MLIYKKEDLFSYRADFWMEGAHFSPLSPQLCLYWSFGDYFIKRNLLFCFSETAPLFGKMAAGKSKSSLHNYCSSWVLWVTCHFWSFTPTHFQSRTFLSRMDKLSAYGVVHMCQGLCVRATWGKVNGHSDYAKSQETFLSWNAEDLRNWLIG